MTRPLPQNAISRNGAKPHAVLRGHFRLSVPHRFAVALLGGYAFSWGVTSLGVVGMVALGGDFHEAEIAMLLLAFLVFLSAFLWAFATVSLARVWAVLGGGAALMIAAAWGLQRVLLS